MSKHLTESLEDYLEAIAELIAIKGHAHAKEIAQKLNVKMPSVTGALRQLEKMNFIIYNTHYPVQLTPAGKAIADEVINRHQVLKKFFIDILGLGVERASTTACHLEHVVDSDTVERFVLFSRAIENRRDARSLQTYLTEAMELLSHEESRNWLVLGDLEVGAKVKIEWFGRNLREREHFRLAIGEKMELLSISLDKTIWHFDREGEMIDLPNEAVENIWCSELVEPEA